LDRNRRRDSGEGPSRPDQHQEARRKQLKVTQTGSRGTSFGEWVEGTAVNAGGGALGGAGMAGVGHLNRAPQNFQAPEGFTPRAPRTDLHMSIDGTVGGVGAGIAGAVNEVRSNEPGDEESPRKETKVQQSSPQERSVRDAFG
jgi:hypothetical protein